MCGIAGIVKENSKIYTEALGRMVFSLKHRGPDQKGAYFFSNCALGHTRLNIIDFKYGKQPMFDDRGRAVVFNGEIYGYKEIKKQLKDYNFQTFSDTEIILALYDKYGHKCLDHLPGMFSFAIWDDKKQELFCARDRFGEKPFYYAIGRRKEFIFASELKAIIKSNLLEPIISRQAIKHYLQFLYINPKESVFKNIFVLPPAHYLVFKGGQIEIIKYWSVNKNIYQISLAEAKDKFRVLLEEAIRKQLISDTPVGILLSGGLDSSTIVALAHKINPNIKTLTFKFDSIIDETPYAKVVSRKYRVKNIQCNINDYDLEGIIIKMAEIYDEPFADSANIPMYLLSKEAAKYYKVVLSGDGADELLGGYDYWYNPLFIYSQFKFKKGKKYFIENLFFKTLARFIIKKNNFLNFYQAARRIRENQGYTKDVLGVYLEQKKYFSNQEVEDLWIGGGKKVLTGIKKRSDINDALLFDIENYLAGDILVKTDRSAMANGLEVRLPFLDFNFASFCLSLPYQFKLNERENKILLRKAYEDLWPKMIKKRDKQGLGAPIDFWFKEGLLDGLRHEYLNKKDNYLYALLDYRAAKKYFYLNNYQTWILLVLSIWLEQNRYPIK